MKIGTIIYDAKKNIDRRNEMNNTDIYQDEYTFNKLTYKYELMRIVCIG